MQLYENCRTLENQENQYVELGKNAENKSDFLAKFHSDLAENKPFIKAVCNPLFFGDFDDLVMNKVDTHKARRVHKLKLAPTKVFVD